MSKQPPARRRCHTKPPPGPGEIVLLLGCTASGKTAVSLELTRRLNAEILSIDSMQVYRRMDIGTAKPSPQERAAVRHHLIDVAEPSESFSVARFVELADAAIADIAGRGRRVLALAGTPLYLMGLMYGMFDGPSADERLRAELRARAERDGTPALHAELAQVDPEAAARIHPNDYKRIERALEVWRLTGRRLSEQQQQWSSGRLRYPAKVVGIRRQKEDNSRRINARVRQMIEAGLVDEVRSLHAEPAGLSEQARQALGYAQIIAHLRGATTLEEAVEEIKIQTRRLAKHQRTWFRKFPMAAWVDVAPDEPAAPVVDRLGQLLAS
jgi:tRNA dimethylallyltransferase